MSGQISVRKHDMKVSQEVAGDKKNDARGPMPHMKKHMKVCHKKHTHKKGVCK